MVDADDTGVATMDPVQANALTDKEKKLFKEITNNKAEDIKEISGMSCIIIQLELLFCLSSSL